MLIVKALVFLWIAFLVLAGVFGMLQELVTWLNSSPAERHFRKTLKKAKAFEAEVNAKAEELVAKKKREQELAEKRAADLDLVERYLGRYQPPTQTL